VLVVWSDTLDNIIPTCHDFEERLIKLLWRSRPPMSALSHSSHQGSQTGSVSGHSHSAMAQPSRLSALANAAVAGSAVSLNDPEKGLDSDRKVTKTRRTWYGRKRTIVIDPTEPEARPARLFAPFYNGIAAGLSFVFIGNGVRLLIREWLLDGDFIRFALCALLPLLFCVSLFFCLQIIQNVTMAYVASFLFAPDS
jgi:hypothetical protein